MSVFYVVADYREEPSEGMQVVSKTLVDGLREAGLQVQVLPPEQMKRWLPTLLRARRGTVVFTHGPGTGVVLASVLLRRLTSMRVVWVATRPDLGRLPRVLRGRRSAHAIVGNRRRSDLDNAAMGHKFLQQFIGIDPSRLGAATDGEVQHRRERATGPAPVRLLHIGHLRANRGLDLLVQAKLTLGDRIHVVVQGSPTFPADPAVLDALEASGVVVRRDYVANLGDLYRECDLYVFPARPEAEGAIELPLGVLEAVACQRPVLTNDFGAVSEALADVPGVNIATPDTFVARLEELLGNPVSLAVPAHPFPAHLHASRVVSAVQAASGAVTCA